MKKLFLLFLAICCCASFIIDARPLHPKARRRLHKKRHIKHKKHVAKKTYLKKHDINHDGVVNSRDRILWIRKTYTPTKVVTMDIIEEDEYFLEEIDINNDGQISSDEMAYWIKTYDTNNDGTLDDSEISQIEVAD